MTAREQFDAWWKERQPRERLILAAGAAVLALMVFFLGIWEPLAQARRTGQAELDAARRLANKIEALAAEVQRGRGGGAAAATRSLNLLSAVDQAARAPELVKPPSRIQPEGDRQVKLWLDDVPFDGLVAWLLQLQTQYGIVVADTEMERRGEGLVSARLTLVRP